MEPSKEGLTKVCINGPGLMTKMAPMPIYGKNLKKSSFPEPKGQLGMQHRGIKLFKVCINDDPSLILTYFMARSNMVVFLRLDGENCYKVI